MAHFTPSARCSVACAYPVFPSICAGNARKGRGDRLVQDRHVSIFAVTGTGCPPCKQPYRCLLEIKGVLAQCLPVFALAHFVLSICQV
jgi:hypothetical protein